MFKLPMLTGPNLAVVVIVVSFTLGMAGGVYIDRKVMQGRIDKIELAHLETLRVREVKRGEDERAARDKERALSLRVGEIEQRKTDEIATIRIAHSDELARLQNRPARKPAGTSPTSTPGPACQGSTGAELSREDAGFLVGEAARADEHRAALSACYSAYDSVGAVIR